MPAAGCRPRQPGAFPEPAAAAGSPATTSGSATEPRQPPAQAPAFFRPGKDGREPLGGRCQGWRAPFARQPPGLALTGGARRAARLTPAWPERCLVPYAERSPAGVVAGAPAPACGRRAAGHACGTPLCPLGGGWVRQGAPRCRAHRGGKDAAGSPAEAGAAWQSRADRSADCCAASVPLRQSVARATHRLMTTRRRRVGTPARRGCSAAVTHSRLLP